MIGCSINPLPHEFYVGDAIVFQPFGSEERGGFLAMLERQVFSPVRDILAGYDCVDTERLQQIPEGLRRNMCDRGVIRTIDRLRRRQDRRRVRNRLLMRLLF